MVAIRVGWALLHPPIAIWRHLNSWVRKHPRYTNERSVHGRRMVGASCTHHSHFPFNSHSWRRGLFPSRLSASATIDEFEESLTQRRGGIGTRMDDQSANRAGGGVSFRKLRIAWSVSWSVLTVLLLMLWLRSYTYHDILAGKRLLDVYNLTLESCNGHLEIMIRSLRSLNLGPDTSTGPPFYLRSQSADLPGAPSLGRWCFALLRGKGWLLVIGIPQWATFLLASSLTIFPWLASFRWSPRFSVRALLIATTLIAVMLGLLVGFTND